MRRTASRRARAAAVTVATALGALAASHPRVVPDDATTNDHRTIAGVLEGAEYTLALELRRTAWHPNTPDTLTVDVPAFAEAGRPASVPGPMIRVPAGTHLRVTVRNALAERATVHGLHDHGGGRDSIVLGPGESREVRFTATTVGTFAYFARTTAARTLFGRRDDSQLMAAFLVDPAGTDVHAANARERVLVITAWDDSVRNPASPYGPRQVYAINGRSWPHTERLAYAEGDSVRWRVLNLSQHSHPMHLHGTYFRVTSRGTPFADTARGPAAPLAVTEFLPAGATMALAWKAERPGNWLFHCHTINHIDEALRLGGAATAATAAPHAAPHAGHADVTDAMAGLVTAITVTGAPGRARRPAAPARRLRVLVTERRGAGGAPARAYVLQRDGREPAADSIELPGSLLELRQGEPTAITVVNRGSVPTAVHWHGMELESFYDGVAGWSGAGARVAPVIAPGDSFTARMTPPRAGTFIYHTHAGELAQLTGGLYGALVVRPRRAAPDPHDRVLVLADSTADTLAGRTPPSMVEGRSRPSPLTLEAGATHRLRFVSIGAVTRKRVRLLAGDRVLSWTPVAKDGADLPVPARQPMPADAGLAAGETLDVLVVPPVADDLVLEVTSTYGPPITTRVPVRVVPAAPAVSPRRR